MNKCLTCGVRGWFQGHCLKCRRAASPAIAAKDKRIKLSSKTVRVVKENFVKYVDQLKVLQILRGYGLELETIIEQKTREEILTLIQDKFTHMPMVDINIVTVLKTLRDLEISVDK